ncbi:MULTISPECIES: VOC family protein [Bacillus cereus group]|uniref:Fosmidomycin resistance protein n=1 Tax=Bacillus cereus TaxID=1396 RepID=A0AA44QAL5_BACCE|nr:MULTISPECIES: VOC family protein [Bacillus cereus group]PFN05813.1 fosmidomycin resistance protein [Bacillus cereus]PFO77837.1 fosmidomycin resistance protein [Bacillus cereus]PFS00852.1 fosmidomycin resistance protein [Bacillus cereus]PGZ20178.1 fosmidomycin resistance protein [Bacillus cereus]
MIQNIYETHIHVRNLEKAIDFYQNKLGLNLGRKLSKRRVAFFWIGENKEQMLGLWEVPATESMELKHFAFGVKLDFLKQSKKWLEDRGIEVVGSQGKCNKEPIVQRWMPAASVYFMDYDGNKLEFISILYDEPDELEYASYLSEWEVEKR